MAARRDVHRQVARSFAKCVITCLLGRFAPQIEQDANPATRMNVGSHLARVVISQSNALSASDDDVFSQLGDGFRRHLLEGFGETIPTIVVHVACDGFEKRLKILRAGYEIGLAIHLDDDAHAPVFSKRSVYLALACRAPGLLGGAGKPFFPQIAHCLFKIPLIFLEGFLAVHDARTCVGS